MPAAALAQDLPAPLPADALHAGDAPNDRGGAIAVIWPAAKDEREKAVKGEAAPYEYVISIGADGPFVEAERVLGTAGWQSDIANKFSFAARKSKDHAVIVEPSVVFDANDLALAALGNATMTAKVMPHFGAAAIETARAILRTNKIEDAAELRLYPEAVDEIGREILAPRSYRVRLEARGLGGGTVTLGEVAAVRAQPNWFDWTKTANLFVMLLLGASIMAFIAIARKNPNLYLRRIGGLDAIDEALGRATEMGKPVLFVHGLETLQKVPTIAAINILGEVAKKVARYDTKLICCNYDPIVLTVSEETVKEGFMSAGRPDAFNPDDVFLAGADQFSYVAAVDGIMIRQRPAANIYAGYFYAESLLLAETGASTGAIQIAATDAYTQLPFFVTTCDYTLMGEELYAASAYLSRDPLLLGSLRGQDVGKALVIAYLLLGTAAATAGLLVFKDLVST